MCTILLFDVDGTLLSSGGAGRRAMERAFEQAHGHLPSYSFGGKTDPQIVREGLEELGIPFEAAAVQAVLDGYLELLPGEVGRGGVRLLDGVLQVLEALEARRELGGRLAVGLGTGNVRAGAFVKLGPVGLAERFDFGGFGCDAEDRAAVLRVGARRGAESLGEPVESCRVVVIGDTPRDVQAARDIGADCVAVATGPFELEELRAQEPTHAFPDLLAEGVLAAILGEP